MKRFALIGAAGYIASRHMAAIRDTGHVLMAALDPHDSVGILDHYFPEAAFFTEFERFDRHLEKLKQVGTPIDFLTICSPNYLHDAHIRFGLRSGANVICEKPVVLNPWNIDQLRQAEADTGKRVFVVQQLRFHPAIKQLKDQVVGANPAHVHEVDLTYVAPRGKWYYASWKGDESKSGGIAANIGIHLFDLLTWLFGRAKSHTIHIRSHDRISGASRFELANVRWFLSINGQCLPEAHPGDEAFRRITIDQIPIDLSTGFGQLHTAAYRAALRGDHATGLAEAKEAVQILHDIRHSPVVGPDGTHHALAELPLQPHPFGSL